MKSLVPEPILSIVQSVLPLGSIAGDEIAKVTFTFLRAVTRAVDDFEITQTRAREAPVTLLPD